MCWTVLGWVQHDAGLRERDLNFLSLENGTEWKTSVLWNGSFEKGEIQRQYGKGIYKRKSYKHIVTRCPDKHRVHHWHVEQRKVDCMC